MYVSGCGMGVGVGGEEGDKVDVGREGESHSHQ